MAKIVIGIPTWNEAEFIQQHTARVDHSIFTTLGEHSVELVLSDNCSPDGTASLFEEASTQTAKTVLFTKKRGKGYNFANLFRHSLDVGADVLITLDADLEEVPVDWLPALAEPILSGEAALVMPLYRRYWYDGNLTNQVVAPLAAAVTGAPLRQPIGGEFGFSPHALKILTDVEWSTEASGFGTDIFAVLKLLDAGQPIVQAPLSLGKIHSWRSDTADELDEEMSWKFTHIVRGLLQGLQAWRGATPRPFPGAFPKGPPLGQSAKHYTLDHIRQSAEAGWKRYDSTPTWKDLVGPVNVDAGGKALADPGAWTTILHRIWKITEFQMPDHLFEVFRILFFLRLVGVLEEYDNDNVDLKVDEIARRLSEALRE